MACGGRCAPGPAAMGVRLCAVGPSWPSPLEARLPEPDVAAVGVRPLGRGSIVRTSTRAGPRVAPRAQTRRSPLIDYRAVFLEGSVAQAVSDATGRVLSCNRMFQRVTGCVCASAPRCAPPARGPAPRPFPQVYAVRTSVVVHARDDAAGGPREFLFVRARPLCTRRPPPPYPLPLAVLVGQHSHPVLCIPCAGRCSP